MKLYTEEQIKQILEELQKAFLPKNIECDGAHCIGCWKDVVRTTMQMANSFTPIQLPSDEEIAREASNEYQEQKQSYENSVEMFPIDFGNYLEVGFIEGAIWMRNKIQGGNK